MARADLLSKGYDTLLASYDAHHRDGRAASGLDAFVADLSPGDERLPLSKLYLEEERVKVAGTPGAVPANEAPMPGPWEEVESDDAPQTRTQPLAPQPRARPSAPQPEEARPKRAAKSRTPKEPRAQAPQSSRAQEQAGEDDFGPVPATFSTVASSLSGNFAQPAAGKRRGRGAAPAEPAGGEAQPGAPDEATADPAAWAEYYRQCAEYFRQAEASITGAPPTVSRQQAPAGASAAHPYEGAAGFAAQMSAAHAGAVPSGSMGSPYSAPGAHMNPHFPHPMAHAAAPAYSALGAGVGIGLPSPYAPPPSPLAQPAFGHHAGLHGLGLPGAGLPGMPGAGLPGMPGAGLPGMGLPGAGFPGAGFPGAGLPGAGHFGAGHPGAGLSGAGLSAMGPLGDQASRFGMERMAAAAAEGRASDDALANLLMSWYYSGYYTGLYAARQDRQNAGM